MPDQRLVVHADFSQWVLFHPDDLQHHLKDPDDWWDYGFALQPELEAGTLLSVKTPGAGTYHIRLTNEGLTEREKPYCLASSSHRLQVNHGCLFLGETRHLPNGKYYAQYDYDEQDMWVEVPSGRYLAHVSTLEWDKDPQSVSPDGVATPDALTAFVVHLERVDEWPPFDDSVVRLLDEARQADLAADAPELQPAGPVLVLNASRPCFPGVFASLPISALQCELLSRVAEELYFDFEVAVVQKLDAADDRACLLHVSSFGDSVDGQGKELSGSGAGRGSLGALTEKDGAVWAAWIPGCQETWPSTAVLREAFARYARLSPLYREHHRFPDFDALRVLHCRDDRYVLGTIAERLPVSGDVKWAWFRLTPEELIAELLLHLSK